MMLLDFVVPGMFVYVTCFGPGHRSSKRVKRKEGVLAN